MKRFAALVISLLILFLCGGCHTPSSSAFALNSQGIKVKMDCDGLLVVTEDQEPSSILAFSEPEVPDEYIGFIHISPAEAGQNIESLCDDLLAGLYSQHSLTSTKLNEKCQVVSINNGYDGYMFLFYDREFPVILQGKFFAGKEQMMKIAKTITLEEIPRTSPYPENYEEIVPQISIRSSGERVTEWATIPQVWKNKPYDFPSYTTLLKDRKTYVLSDIDEGIIFEDGEYKTTTLNANVSFKEGSLFFEGANGFRIAPAAESKREEFYVFITAEYGSSGKLTYVFKCIFS